MSDELAAKLREIVTLVVAQGLARADEIRGCDAAEIAALEAKVGVVLPAAYKAFLAAMGHGAGAFLRGTDVWCRVVPELQAWANEVLSETGAALALPADAFVFAMHQGYQFWYLQLDGSDDPPVYYFLEKHRTFERIDDSFTSTLRRWVETSRSR